MKYILLSNLRIEGKNTPSWDAVPEDLSRKIINEYFAKQGNEIGFGGFKTENEIVELTPFKEWQPEFRGTGSYSPYGSIDTYNIALFKLDMRMLDCLELYPYTNFYLGHEGFYTDNIVFFRDKKEIGRIIPYESRFEFELESQEQKNILLSLDERISVNLHSNDPLVIAEERE